MESQSDNRWPQAALNETPDQEVGNVPHGVDDAKQSLAPTSWYAAQSSILAALTEANLQLSSEQADSLVSLISTKLSLSEPLLAPGGPYPSDDSLISSLTPTFSVDARTVQSVEFELWDAHQTAQLASGSGIRTAKQRVAWVVPAGLLQDETEYVWRTRPHADQELRSWSAFRRFIVSTANGAQSAAMPPAPQAVENLTATPADGGAYLTWSPADPGPGAWITDYIIDVRDADEGHQLLSVSVRGTETSAVINKLPTGGQYRYTIQPRNDWRGGPFTQSVPTTAVRAPLPAEEFAQMATAYLVARSRLVTGTDALQTVIADTTPNHFVIRDAVTAAVPDAHALREELARRDMKFTGYTPALSNLAVIPAGDGRSVTVRAQVYERYEQTSALSTSSPYSSVQEADIPYTFVFSGTPREGDSASDWHLDTVTTPRIESDKEPVEIWKGAEDEGPLPEPVLREADGTFINGPEEAEVRAIRNLAISDYAHQFWKHPNPYYRIYPNDCTNFASQAVRAGGMEMRWGFYRSDGAWWYRSGSTWPYASFTWGGAHNFFNHLGKNQRAVFRQYWNQAVPGDILFWDLEGGGHIDHVSIIVNYRGGQLWYAQHSDPYDNRSVYEGLRGNPHARLYIAHITG